MQSFANVTDVRSHTLDVCSAMILVGETPFVKEAGCNKMTCTRTGCQNVQCYVCSQPCNYSHFNDASLGGKEGNCHLYDDVKDRHARETREAENAARTPLSEATNAKHAASDLGFEFSL